MYFVEFKEGWYPQLRDRLRPKNLLKNITKNVCVMWCILRVLVVHFRGLAIFFLLFLFMQKSFSHWSLCVDTCRVCVCVWVCVSWVFRSIAFFSICTGWVALTIDHLAICAEEEEFNRKLRAKEIRESDSPCADTTTKSVLYDFRRRSDFNKNIIKVWF